MSHAIYGILEPIINNEDNTIMAIQLVIVNGGDGIQHHKSNSLSNPTITRRMPDTRTLLKWQHSD